MRTWQELIDEARATGTWDDYQGDGATVPWEIAERFSTLAGIALYEYKAHLDEHYPLAFRLHDWCYTPYGSLIGVTREEADAAMRDLIAIRGDQAAILDSGICFLAVRSAGEPFFGNSQVGFDPGLFRQVTGRIWRFDTVANYKLTVGLRRITGTPQHGFTETWYFTAAGDDAARNRIVNYLTERAKCLSNSWEVGTFIRLSKMKDNCVRHKPQGRTKWCCIPRAEGKIQCVCPAPVKGRLAVGDQGWDGVLIEYCTDPVQHTGCLKCESRQRPIVRQFILRGIPDEWYTGGQLALSPSDKTNVQNFACGYIKNELRAGSVVCDDACSDTQDTSCTTVIFQRFQHCCPKFDRPVMRKTGRAPFLPRGRRSKRRTT